MEESKEGDNSILENTQAFNGNTSSNAQLDLIPNIKRSDGSHDLLGVINYASHLRLDPYVHLTKASLYGLAAEVAMVDLWDSISDKINAQLKSDFGIKLRQYNKNQENPEESNLSKSSTKLKKCFEFEELNELISRCDNISKSRDKLIHQGLNEEIKNVLEEKLNTLEKNVREFVVKIDNIMKKYDLERQIILSPSSYGENNSEGKVCSTSEAVSVSTP